MPINTGYIELFAEDSEGGPAVRIRVYYDATVDPSGPQPLINGPRGYCLDITNTTGRNVPLTVRVNDSEVINVLVGQGDPVTTGPASGRSRTAAQLAAFGLQFRHQVQIEVQTR